MSDYQFITVSHEDHVFVITLNRPEVLNALHGPAHAECAAALDTFAADNCLRVAVITGTGTRAFCAGNDLKFQAQGNKLVIPPTGFGGITSRFDLNKPVIAAVNGLALGGGFEIALACDIIVAGEQARFGLPEPKVGMAALAGGLLRLPRAVGMKRAMSMILTARHVSAAEALDWGFVAEVVESGTELKRAFVIGKEIAGLSPAAVRAAKQVASLGIEMPLDEATKAQFDFPAVREMRSSADYQEGARAFAEKRSPKWA